MATGEELGYLVMVNAPAPEKDLEGFTINSVDMQSMVTQAKMINAKHVLFIFDSCFSGTVLNLRERVTPNFISDNVKLPVRQFITAGRANESVPDYSVFKQCFLDILEGRDVEPIQDGYLTGEELGLYLKNKVPSYNKNQHPQYGKIKDPKLDKGDFVFLLGSSGAIVKEPVKGKAPLKGRLYVDTHPKDARVRILNIGPKFTQGMALDARRYHVKVSAEGYETQKMWVSLIAGQDKTLDIHLKRKGRYQPVDSITGIWNVNANNYTFILSITQVGTSISGYMNPVNHKDSNSTIKGSINGDDIHFFRTMGGRKKFQEYRGTIMPNRQKMTGSFSHANQQGFSWFAHRRSR